MHTKTRSAQPTAIYTDLAAIFVSLELNRSNWLVTSLSPRSGEKMSKHSVSAGDIAGLFALFSKLGGKSRIKTGRVYPVITIQEAGLDGFWLHRVLEKEGVESDVVDPARLQHRVGAGGRKLTALMVRHCCEHCWPTSGGSRACARWVHAPSPEEEDQRRICRERKGLIHRARRSCQSHQRPVVFTRDREL
jgi:transposase